jgi:hypothetical protein
MPLMNIFCQDSSLADKRREKKAQRNSFVSKFPLSRAPHFDSSWSRHLVTKYKDAQAFRRWKKLSLVICGVNG